MPEQSDAFTRTLEHDAKNLAVIDVASSCPIISMSFVIKLFGDQDRNRDLWRYSRHNHL